MNVQAQSIGIDPNDNQTLYLGAFDGSIYKSTNGGVSFALTASPGTTGPIVRVVVGKPDSAVYVVDDQGLFRSRDGGQSWMEIQSGIILDFEVSPTDPNDLWVSTETSALHTTTGGNPWSPLPGLTASVVAVNWANENQLYAVDGESFMASTDGGQTWTTRATGLPSASMGLFLKVDPKSFETAYVAPSNYGLWKTTTGGL